METNCTELDTNHARTVHSGCSGTENGEGIGFNSDKLLRLSQIRNPTQLKISAAQYSTIQAQLIPIIGNQKLQ